MVICKTISPHSCGTHICVKATQHGAIIASKQPRTNRKASRERKLVHAVMAAREEPHSRIAAEMTLPLGSLTKMTAAIGCMTSWAT